MESYGVKHFTGRTEVLVIAVPLFYPVYARTM